MPLSARSAATGLACTLPAVALALGLLARPGTMAHAQMPQPPSSVLLPGAPPPSPPIEGKANPVIGSVDGHLIYLDELGRAAQTLPENLRGLPFDVLYPVLLDRLIDHQALVIMAKRSGLEDKPEIRKEIEAATERILEGAWLAQEARPKITEAAVQARYNKLFANRPATEEVRARHILVGSEAEAMKVIQELRDGADFATVARVVSKDPDREKGGDLGFFRREQVWPAFADLAFSLQPGQIGATPVRNEFGWHVVKVEEKRLVAPPSFSDIQATLRQELLAQGVQHAVERARSQVIIRRFNLDGSELDTGPRLNAGPPLPVNSPAPAPR
ncbi:MAG: peptidylprolyl isomerase [Acetobacteraceae bacterium]